MTCSLMGLDALACGLPLFVPDIHLGRRCTPASAASLRFLLFCCWFQLGCLGGWCFRLRCRRGHPCLAVSEICPHFGNLFGWIAEIGPEAVHGRQLHPFPKSRVGHPEVVLEFATRPRPSGFASSPRASDVDVKCSQHTVQVRVPIVPIAAVIENNAALEFVWEQIVGPGLPDPLRHNHL